MHTFEITAEHKYLVRLQLCNKLWCSSLLFHIWCFCFAHSHILVSHRPRHAHRSFLHHSLAHDDSTLVHYLRHIQVHIEIFAKVWHDNLILQFVVALRHSRRSDTTFRSHFFSLKATNQHHRDNQPVPSVKRRMVADILHDTVELQAQVVTLHVE